MSKIRPYLIVTPCWWVSAGVRVMHTLCHELNSLGFDARLLLTHDIVPGGPRINPALHTPVFNGSFKDEWAAFNEEAIVIYTDDITDNPLGAKRVARYVLGKEVPNPKEDPQSYRFYYSRAFATKRQSSNRVLFWVPSDLAAFNDKNTGERTQDMLWLGKGAKFCTEPPPGAIPITYDWPPNRSELALQLRKTRRLYSYDALSATNIEAILCGAVVVLKHFSYHDWAWTRQELEAMEPGSGGYAYGDSDFEIDRALRSRQEAVDNIRYHNARLPLRLLEFVDDTQRFFKA